MTILRQHNTIYLYLYPVIHNVDKHRHRRIPSAKPTKVGAGEALPFKPFAIGPGKLELNKALPYSVTAKCQG